MAEPLDVTIVGFGPADAVAAGLLGQAGLTVWVADKLPGVCEIPRAIALDAGDDAGSADRTMRDRFAIAGDGGAWGERSQLGIALDDLSFGGPWRMVDMMVNRRARAKLSWVPGAGDRQNPGDQNTIGALAAPAHRARGNSQNCDRSTFSLSGPRQCSGCTSTVDFEAADKCRFRSLTLSILRISCSNHRKPKSRLRSLQMSCTGRACVKAWRILLA